MRYLAIVEKFVRVNMRIVNPKTHIVGGSYYKNGKFVFSACWIFSVYTVYFNLLHWDVNDAKFEIGRL